MKEKEAAMEEKDYQEQLRQVNGGNPFMLHNGIRATFLDEKTAQVRAEVGPGSLNGMGGVHGGLMMAAAEIAAGLAARNDGRKYVTLDASFRFISGTRTAKAIKAEASITKRGGTICFTRAAVREEGTEKLLAEGEFTFYCLG